MTIHKLLSLGLTASLLAGCGTLPREPLGTHMAASGEVAACARFLSAFDEQVAAVEVVDVQAARVAGFPYLRSSRFLASFRDELNEQRRPAWLQAMYELGRRGQQVELANLPDTEATWETLGVSGRGAAGRRLEHCSGLLLGRDRQQPQNWALLQERSAVADAYADYQRLIGLYPLSALAAAYGIAGLHAEIRATFERPPAALPVAGELLDYTPPAADTARLPPVEWYAAMPRDALGIPQLSQEQLQHLFRRHAPIWRIDTAQRADRIGTPYAAGDGWTAIDTGRPVVYLKTSYTRWRKQTLLQLNYIIWFPARPLTGAFDLLGGHLDGITWRVTLGPDGAPLLYDAMHNCGCYHMAFPSTQLHPRNNSAIWQEPLLIPAAAPAINPGERIRIRVEQRTHYLQSVEAVKSYKSTLTYSFQDYDDLRSLPLPEEGRRSLFDQQGLIPGSERLERWLLWPLGVPEPGAMRQWGTHATAFVGKRHFDDPDLIERYFSAVPPP